MATRETPTTPPRGAPPRVASELHATPTRIAATTAELSAHSPPRPSMNASKPQGARCEPSTTRTATAVATAQGDATPSDALNPEKPAEPVALLWLALAIACFLLSAHPLVAPSFAVALAAGAATALLSGAAATAIVCLVVFTAMLALPMARDAAGRATSARLATHSHDAVYLNAAQQKRHRSRCAAIASSRPLVVRGVVDCSEARRWKGFTLLAKVIEACPAQVAAVPLDGADGRPAATDLFDATVIDQIRGTTGRPWGPHAAMLDVGARAVASRGLSATAYSRTVMCIGDSALVSLWTPEGAPLMRASPRLSDGGGTAALVADRKHVVANHPAPVTINLSRGDLLVVPAMWWADVSSRAPRAGVVVCGATVPSGADTSTTGRLFAAIEGVRCTRVPRGIKPSNVDDQSMAALPVAAPRGTVEFPSVAQADGPDAAGAATAGADGPHTPARGDDVTLPTSVNYFISRQCNYKVRGRPTTRAMMCISYCSAPSRLIRCVWCCIPRRCPARSALHMYRRAQPWQCEFCYHTTINEDPPLPLEDAKRGMRMLQEAGMAKLNIAGGEPFLQQKFLRELCAYVRGELGVNITIISNGSLIRRQHFGWIKKYVNVLGISCDSFSDGTNRIIGRYNPKKTSEEGAHRRKVFQVADWCREFNVKFKLNTVVNKFNWDEDMTEPVRRLAPARWKVFQVLLLKGENSGEGGDKRDARPLLIHKTQFERFVQRHADAGLCPVAEDNDTMQNSYLLFDEKLRPLDCSSGAKTPGDSLLDVGVEEAVRQARFDRETFEKRGGVFDWSGAQESSQLAELIAGSRGVSGGASGEATATGTCGAAAGCGPSTVSRPNIALDW